jgi:hypothetical protein
MSDSPAFHPAGGVIIRRVCNRSSAARARVLSLVRHMSQVLGCCLKSAIEFQQAGMVPELTLAKYT